MTDKEYIESLEARIKRLEDILENINLPQANTVTFQTSPLASVTVGESCNLSFENCSIGGVMNDIEYAEERIEELEDRIEDALGRLDDIE